LDKRIQIFAVGSLGWIDQFTPPWPVVWVVGRRACVAASMACSAASGPQFNSLSPRPAPRSPLRYGRGAAPRTSRTRRLLGGARQRTDPRQRPLGRVTYLYSERWRGANWGTRPKSARSQAAAMLRQDRVVWAGTALPNPDYYRPDGP